MPEILTEAQAYRAMYFFLEAIWKRTGSKDVAAMLGDLSLLDDGAPADPAMRSDFAAAVVEARGPRAIGLDLHEP